VIIRQLPLAQAYVRDLAAFAGGRFSIVLTAIAGLGLLEFLALVLLGTLLHAAGLPGSGPVPAWLTWPLGLGPALGIFLGARLLQLVVRRLVHAGQTRLDADFTRHLRGRFHRAAMDADWLTLTRLRSSDLAQTEIDELPRAGTCTAHLLNLAQGSVVAAIQVALAVALAPGFTLGVLAAGLLAAYALRSWQRRQLQLQRQLPAQRSSLASAVHEHLAGLRLAKSHGRTEAHLGQLQHALDGLAQLTVRAQDRAANLRFWLESTTLLTLGTFATLALFWKPLGLGPLLLLGFLFSRLLGHAAQLHGSWQQLAVNLLSYEAAEALRNRLRAAAEPVDHGTDRLALTRELRFDRVAFRYSPAHRWALEDISLTLPARRITAICGRSGAGKSTLADLALGLLQPEQGRVVLDGTPLAGPRLPAWRRSIGYVPQDNYLFHDTIRANLRWANPDATDSEITAALRAAAAHDFVARLPQGLDTLVGDRGQRLSGGERQRLALSRALLRRPALLILDEATSSLDPANERSIQEALERLRGETTILLIAHRLSTVRAADHIVVLEAGRIAETGTWAELAARTTGPFRALLAADARA
jgi:ATP-binding cassette subfamily C protein